MRQKTVAVMALMCLALLLSLCLIGEDVHAGSAMDKGMASKEGVGASLGNKEIDKSKLPNKIEVGITIASTIGMVALFKYL